MIVNQTKIMTLDELKYPDEDYENTINYEEDDFNDLHDKFVEDWD